MNSKTLDSDVATVDEDGVVTATGVGTTYIRIYNKQNDCYAAVKVQVNGEQGRIAAKIVGGWNHFAALKANGEVWTWGHNGYGQLGVGNTERKIKPTKTNIYDSKDTTQTEYAIDVAAGAYHTLVLKSDGTVWATGYNGYGQLGTGTTQSETEFKTSNRNTRKSNSNNSKCTYILCTNRKWKSIWMGIQLLWTT